MTGAFPATYEELQPIPVQQVGQLPFAGDDGMQVGGTYRARLSVARSCDLLTRAEVRQAGLYLRLRAPDPQGTWVWGAWSAEIPLPATICDYLEQGATPLAPTLRETVRRTAAVWRCLISSWTCQPGRSRRGPRSAECWASPLACAR